MRVTVIIRKGERFYVAEALEVDAVSQGETIDEALRNIREAISLYFEGGETAEHGEPVLIATLEVPEVA